MIVWYDSASTLILGIASTLFCGACFYKVCALAARLRSTPPKLVLDQTGITQTSIHYKNRHIRWTDVEEFYAVDLGFKSRSLSKITGCPIDGMVVYLRLSTSGQHLRDTSRAGRALRALAFDPVVDPGFSSREYGIKAEELVRILEKYRRHYSQPAPR